MRGIDVSRYNGTVNWAQVNASGLDFALVKAGYGNDISQKEPLFDVNVSGALGHRMAVGAYWFGYALTPTDAVREAKVFQQVLAPYRGKMTFPVAYDFEGDSIRYFREQTGRQPTNTEIDTIAHAFLDTMKAAGWYVCLYTNLDFIRTGRFSATTLKAYDVWLADYTGGPDYACGIQQTGDAGKVPGITGDVDLDVSFKDYPAIIRAGGYNGYPKQGTVAIDTTMDLTRKGGQTYTIKTVSTLPVTLTAGTPSVVKITPFPRNGNAQLFALTATGKPGQAAGIYTTVTGEQPVKRFVFKIAG